MLGPPDEGSAAAKPLLRSLTILQCQGQAFADCLAVFRLADLASLLEMAPANGSGRCKTGAEVVQE